MNEKLININSNDKKYYLNILKLEPNNYDAVLKLGLIDVNENNFLSAKEKFKKLITLDKSKYEGYLNLSNIYCFQGKVLKANNILKNFLNNVQEKIEIVNALAINLLNIKKYSDLEILLNKYTDKYESHILFYLKGYMLTKTEKIFESEIFFKKSIGLNPMFWNGYEFLFKQYEKQSRLKDFENLLTSAKKLFKNHTMLAYYESLYNFRLKDYKKSLNILINEEIKNKFLSAKNDVVIADYFHLLSRVYERLGLYNESYGYALKRNETTLNFKENKQFNKKLILDTISAYSNFFDKKNKPKNYKTVNGVKHSNLTFLIGFPRSGTTLLDTILRSHSKTMVLEEKPYLLNVRHNFYKNHSLADILQIDEKDKIKMQEEYFNSFDFESNKVIIDKYPLNLIELGFIKTIFPDSKIILAIRHPLDCIISCVLTSFKMNEGMVNFENIHTTAYFYDVCFKLLFKYFYYYEITYYQIKYENVVKNFEYEIANLIKYLDLNFEKNIINFSQTAKAREKINTPSYDQVIQPIYSKSVNRHKNFNEIKNIKIDINRWIKEFSY